MSGNSTNEKVTPSPRTRQRQRPLGPIPLASVESFGYESMDIPDEVRHRVCIDVFTITFFYISTIYYSMESFFYFITHKHKHMLFALVSARCLYFHHYCTMFKH